MGKLTELIDKYRKAKTLAERLTFSGELVCEIGPELEAFALRSCKREIAEDIYQETLVVIGKNLGKYRGNSDNEFRSWCYTILRRKLINYLRKDKSKQLDSLDEGPMWEVVAAGDPAVSPGVKLDLEYAIELIISVKPRCALLLWAHHLLGWSYELIAEAIGSTYNAVRVDLKRCLALAQSLMEKNP